MDKSNPNTNTGQFDEYDAVGQAQLVNSGKASALELVDAAIATIERLQPSINALVSDNFDRAREIAKSRRHHGVFAGVPTLLKDLLSYPGLPLECGSALFKGNIASEGSDYTAALDSSGLIVLGKTATSEFGLLGNTAPLVNGPTHNPRNPKHSAGGSSGGSAAAVASGMVSVAHASDGGGSIRGPAALNGLFGLKPSRDRTVTTGMAAQTPMSRLLSEHCLSRSVRDSATWLSVTERKDVPWQAIDTVHTPLNRSLKIGCYSDTAFARSADESVLRCHQQTQQLCIDLGHELVQINGPGFDAIASRDAFFSLAANTMQGMLEMLRAMMGDMISEQALEPFTQALLAWHREHPRTVEAAWLTLEQCAASAADSVNDIDVLLSPTTPFSSMPLDALTPASDFAEVMTITEALAGYTAIASFCGWPAMSVPLYCTDTGEPVGSHFAARSGDDALLFQLAYQLESAQPWANRY